MSCESQQNESALRFFKRFSASTLQRRIPVIGGVELTTRCNLNCVHCYVADKTGRQSELSTRQWMNLIDQFADAGCLFLLFTGGETLLREDFSEIYAHACQKGILVTVFTNGTLVSEKIIDLFTTFPPHCIEVSLYGATEKTYEKITNVAGSFQKCIQGIRQLKNQGFNLKLKTMLLTINAHELEEIKAFASNLGVPFRFDAAISPRLNSDPAPLQYRVSPETAVQKESLDRERVVQWRDFYYRMMGVVPSDTIYECGAGMSMFHVDARGVLRPCFMVAGAGQDLLHGRFEDIWYDNSFTAFRGKNAIPESCRVCDNKSLCGYCPGFFELETGSESIRSSFLCEIGKHRKQMIQDFEFEENIDENR